MSDEQVLGRVNLFIGTQGDHGQLYPGVEMPFGLVKLSPDTYPGAATGSAHGGYDYSDRAVLGFSHTRFSGVGCEGVGGNILVLPTHGAVVADNEPARAALDKDSEVTTPGYYAVTLGGPGIRAELTATHHVGLHRYTYLEAAPRAILIDLGRGFNPVRDSHCAATAADELVGEITGEQMPCVGYYRLYFCIRFSRPSQAIDLAVGDCRHGRIWAGKPDGSLRLLVHFSEADDGPLMVKVGLSSISIEQARRNVDAQAPDWDFDGVRTRCRTAWAEVLRKIDVAGPADSETLFYSHLYRTCLSPFDITSSRGTFMGDDGEVRVADGFRAYNGWSNWDTYRTKFPLLALLEPGRMRDMMHSLTMTLEQRMRLVPDEWCFDSYGYSPVPCTRYELSNTMFLDAFAKGIPLIDAEATYNVMAALARLEFRGERGRLGYVPRRPDLTCEYAYDNWAAAEMAKALGKHNDAAFFSERGTWYRNAWDTDLGFPRARDEHGQWLDFPEDPTQINEKYVYEGSMWHWRWLVVHAIGDIVRLMGGSERFLAELKRFFENDLDNHGNEPGIHAPWLFTAAGAPWRSQQWVRRILTEPMLQRYGTHNALAEPYCGRIYRNTPDGLIPEMDDDDGCMAAWYVFSSMGLFPLCVGRPLYALGTPIFEEVTIHHESGNDLRMVSKGWREDAWYIQTARLNGQLVERPWIGHDEIVAGGLLEFEVGSEPNTSWGAASDLPW